MLLRNGADTNIQSTQGGNALHIAASEGDIIAIDELVVGGRMKSVDAVTNKGATALVLAIFQEQVACVERLITLGADVNYQFYEDATPLRLLYSSENAELKAICKRLGF